MQNIFILLMSLVALAQTKPVSKTLDEPCGEGNPLPPGAGIVAFVKSKTLYPLAVVNGQSISDAHNTKISGLQWKEFLSSKGVKVIDGKPHRDGHSNVCIHSFELTKDSKLADFTILYASTKPDLKTPSKEKLAEFLKINKTCVNQGDPPEDKTPPCKKPDLILVSDLNQNKRSEYWVIQPRKWDNGFGILEESQGQLVELISNDDDGSD